MEELFFTSQEAADVIGCSLRQVQHWRNKGLVMPRVDATGTGHSVYYDRKNLTQLAVVHHLLERKYSFQAAKRLLKELKGQDPQHDSPENETRYLGKWSSEKKEYELIKFDKAIIGGEFEAGLASMFCLSLDLLNQQIETGIKKVKDNKSKSKKNDNLSKDSQAE